jgi:hypothetical protein
MVRAAVTRFLVASWCHALPSEQLHRNIADAVFADAPSDTWTMCSCSAWLAMLASVMNLDIRVQGEAWMQNFCRSPSPFEQLCN